jgi:ABC-type lipoprotein release transport system permease subunit
VRATEPADVEIAFVVDVSSFTKKGFIGSTSFEGKRVDLEFDDGNEGVFLTSETAKRMHLRKGSTISILVEDDRTLLIKAVVAGVGKSLRISDSKVYYAVGKEGGAIVRFRRA